MGTGWLPWMWAVLSAYFGPCLSRRLTMRKLILACDHPDFHTGFATVGRAVAHGLRATGEWAIELLPLSTDEPLDSSVLTANPPGAPTGVAASAGISTVIVTFVAPTESGGSAITGYTVTSLPAGGVDSDAGSLALSHVITGLASGTPYTFAVTAANSFGTGPASAPSNSVALPTVPTAPLAPVAVGGDTSATVTFVAPLSDGGSAITGYTVISDPAGGIDDDAGTTGLVHNISGLVNGTPYTFTVTAANLVGTSVASKASNEVTPSTN